ncbi:hypothetical protein T492DRAFT_918994, partial [Pavlovales sp. CCMP2436]
GDAPVPLQRVWCLFELHAAVTYYFFYLLFFCCYFRTPRFRSNGRGAFSSCTPLSP